MKSRPKLNLRCSRKEQNVKDEEGEKGEKGPETGLELECVSRWRRGWAGLNRTQRRGRCVPEELTAAMINKVLEHAL